jgi:hypothetical protein
MKKLIAFFSKFSKIVSIVEYVYKGILVAVDVVTLVKKEIAEIKPDFHYLPALDKVIDYLNKAAEAVALVLKWLGGNTEVVAAAARAEVEAAAAPQTPVDKLVAVTGDLDKIVQENK